MRADTCPVTGTELTQRVRGHRLEVLLLILDVKKISQRAIACHLKHGHWWNPVWCSALVVSGHAPGLKPQPTVFLCSPAGLLNRSWDDLLWGNEELEGRKEASWWFTCFNCSCCHQGGATGLWPSLTPTTTSWPAQQPLRVGGGLIRWG